MPRTALNAQQVTASGLTPTYTPANADGNSIANHPTRVLHVKNASAAAVTVTIPTPGSVDGNAIADRTATVGAGAESFIGPFGAVYRQSDGAVHVDYSAVASVTVAVLQV